MRRPLYILDVFSERRYAGEPQGGSLERSARRYAGNQLAVVRHAEGLTDDEMLAITREMNYSETTFILSDAPREGGYDVRIFTPGGEVPFAGHPTLGTAHVILQDIVPTPSDRVVLNLGVGPIPVRVERDDAGGETLWMTQRPPEFGATHEARDVAGLLGLSPADVDAAYPIQDVSTGLPFTIVPLASLEAVARAHSHREAVLDYVAERPAKAFLVFARGALRRENDLHVRVFVDALGITEDPATGSANGCLAGYLSHHRYLGNAFVDVRVEQGYEMGRPSLLLLRAGPADGAIEVHVGGAVVPVAVGELL